MGSASLLLAAALLTPIPCPAPYQVTHGIDGKGAAYVLARWRPATCPMLEMTVKLTLYRR